MLVVALLGLSVFTVVAPPAAKAQTAALTCLSTRMTPNCGFQLGGEITSSGYLFDFTTLGAADFNLTISPGQQAQAVAQLGLEEVSITTSNSCGEQLGNGSRLVLTSFNFNATIDATFTLVQYPPPTSAYALGAVLDFVGSNYPSSVTFPPVGTCPGGTVATPAYSALSGGSSLQMPVVEVIGTQYSGTTSYYISNCVNTQPFDCTSGLSGLALRMGGTLTASTSPAASCTPTSWTLEQPIGTVTVYRGGTRLSGTAGMQLNVGDRISTGDASRALLSDPVDQKTLVLDANSELVISAPTSSTPTILSILRGALESANKAILGCLYDEQVLTPAAVVAVRATEFTVTVYPDNSTSTVAVQDPVSVQDIASGANVTLSTGQQVTVNDTGGPMSQAALQAAVTTFTPTDANEWWLNVPTTTTATTSISSSSGTTSSESSTTSPGPVPEFPFQLSIVSAFVALMMMSYIALRKKRHRRVARSLGHYSGTRRQKFGPGGMRYENVPRDGFKIKGLGRT